VVLADGCLDAGNVIRAVERAVGDADEPILEHVGAAQRVALAVEAGIGLLASGYAVVAGGAREGVGVDDEVAGSRLDDRGPLRPLSTVLKPPRVSTRMPLVGIVVGMRLLTALTTPPIACEP